MPPDNRPTNDNQPTRKGGLFSTRVQTIETLLSGTGLLIGAGLIWTFAKPSDWRAIGIIMGTAIVCMLVAAVWRLIVTGRA